MKITIHFISLYLRIHTTFILLVLSTGLSSNTYADLPLFQLAIENHLFFPDTLVVPAHTRIQLVITNHDLTPEEFESFELNREKVIMGNVTTTIYIGPLAPGTYPFFGEFYPETAQGQLIAQ